MDPLSYGSLYIDRITLPVPIYPYQVSSDDGLTVKPILRQLGKLLPQESQLEM